METKIAFGLALKKIRKDKGLTQEDFGDVSSRTYLSTLERGMKSITLEKLNSLAQVLGVHPLSLLLLTYMNVDNLQCCRASIPYKARGLYTFRLKRRMLMVR